MSKNDRVEQIFHEVLRRPAEERAATLARLCGTDSEIRREVEALLRADADPGSVPGWPGQAPDPDVTSGEGHGHVGAGPRIRSRSRSCDAPEGIPAEQGTRRDSRASSSTLFVPIGEKPGSVIGRYKLLQQIGEGGFGVVFMAEQREPVTRKVALKIIKLGMDTKQVVARFEQERQALAMMDHPHIARVFDGGATDTGRPYFVMELVRGDPITDYCDTHNLSPKERLELFIQVCQAVQHAHQKGIIHRDIKPRNVLVTVADGRPIPKVIDFGIAKATAGRLTEKTLFTEHRALIGTPEYMSPEQAEMSGVDIDTRSDIYSLGVLLYELLTGTTPFDPKQLRSAAWGELQRIIREVEPERPSTRLSTMKDTLPKVAAHRRSEPAKLRSLIRGDLDWIVMKCLEKDRTRRYETANGLAADVLRHLRCEPVVAGPPSQLYRLRKLVRRNRGAFAAMGAVALALILGLAASTHLFLRERDARRRAVEAERVQAQLRDSAETARAEEATQRKLAENNERAAVQAREEAEEKAYSAALSAAAADLERNDAESVRRQLNAAPQRMRGWEWNCLWNESDRSVACPVKLPPAEQGYAMELSPDGTLLAARAQHTHGEPIQLFDTRTGGSVTAFPATIELIQGGTERMSFSPDNRYLAIQVWGPRNVQIFRLSDRRPMMPSDDPAGFHAFLGFDASGDAAAVLTAEGRAELYRIETWERIRQFDAVRWNELPPCGTFSPDGRLLVVGANHKEPLRILAAEDGRLVAEPPGDPGSRRLAFSDDGRQLAVLTSRPGRVRVYDTATWQDTLTIDLGAPAFSDVQFVETDAGGLSIVTTARDGALRVYDPKTGALRALVHGHPTVAASVRLDRQRDEIVTAHEDGVVRRWDRRRPPVFNTPNPDGALCFLNGDLLLIGGRSGSDRANQVGIADLAGGRTLGQLRSFPVSVKHSSDANGLAASPDGNRLAVSTDTSWGQGRLVVFDLVNAHRVVSCERLMYNDLTCVAWSPDGELIASGTEVGVVLLLDGRSYASRGLLEGHEGAVTQLAFLEGGATLVTASADGTVRYWDPQTHTERRSLGVVGRPSLNALAVSPDGAHLAAGDADGKLRVWDARTGESVAEAQGHAGPIRALAFHREGDRLATGGADRSIRIWDAKAWRELVAFRTGSEVVSLGFSPDGKRLVFAQSDGRIDWFDTGAEADRVVERRLNEESRRVVAPLLDDLAIRYGDLTQVRRHLVNDASLTPVQRQVALAELRIRQDEPSAAAYVPEKAGGTARTAVYEYVLRYRLVRTYMGDWPDFDAVADEILARTDLSQWEREAAADYAISLCSLFDMTNNAADAVIRDSHRNPEDYAAAFLMMEGALQHTPDRVLYRMTLGQTQYRVGLYEEALSNLNQGEARLQGVGAEGIAEQLAFRAMSLHRLGRVEEAAEVRERLEAAAPHDPDAVRRLDPLRTEVAEVLAAAPATAEELSAAREDVARLRLIVPPMPKDENGLRTLGHFARDSGQPVEAERLFRAAAEAARTRFGPDSIRYALRLLDLGSALMGVERAREAEQCIRDATTLLRGLLGPSATAWCAYSLGSALRAQARYADAEAAFREALELLDYRKSEKTDRQLAFMVELADTLSLEAAADPIPPGKNQTDLFAEAETLLLEVGRIVNELTASAAEDIRDAGQRETAGRLVRLYEQWDAAEPGHGYAAKAAEWRASAEKPATQPATTGSMNEVTP